MRHYGKVWRKNPWVGTNAPQSIRVKAIHTVDCIVYIVGYISTPKLCLEVVQRTSSTLLGHTRTEQSHQYQSSMYSSNEQKVTAAIPA